MQYDSFFQPVSGIEMPRFAGMPTFMRLPHLSLDAPETKRVELGVVGVPWDGGTSNRPGPRHGPRQLRDLSTMVRALNPASGINPFTLANCADLGDVSPNPVDLEDSMDRVASFFKNLQKRNKNICSVDKANVLEVSVLWREVISELSEEYPDVELSHMLVDNAAMQLVRDPKQFDVIVTGNLFGDILSDIAAMLTGSIGMLPSASLNSDNKGMYEPVHGSAPDITGKELANPIAAILSVAMMLKYSFNMNEASSAIENSIQEVLSEGYRTYDLEGNKENKLSTSEMGNKIIEKIK